MVTGEMLGQAAGATIVAIATAYGIWRGHKKGDGKAPDHRPPPQNEVKAALDGLRERIDRHADSLGDDLKDMQKSIDRLERTIDRMDADARLGRALNNLSKPGA